MRLTTVLEFDADFGAGGQSHLVRLCFLGKSIDLT